MKTKNKLKTTNISLLVKISFLSAIAFLLMLLEIPLPIFPEFLKIELSDLPALIGAFSLGPIAGVIIELIKNILHLIIRGTSTAMVGELANFIVGSIFVLVAGYMYKFKKNRKSAIVGVILGTIVMSVVAGILNYFILIPAYAKAFKLPVESIVDTGTLINSSITDMWTLVIWSIIPFNLLKGAIISVVTIIVYKKIGVILNDKSIKEAA